MEIVEGTRYGGQFEIDGSGRSGELVFAGADTNLRVQDPRFFKPDNITGGCIHGRLNDLTHVSLVDCNAGPVPGSHMAGGEHYYWTDIFTHYVVHGHAHIVPDQKTVQCISFVIDDASAVFGGSNVFGHVLQPRRHIRALAKSNARVLRRDGVPAIGKRPEILFYTGEATIFAAETALGKVSARHNPRMHLDNGVAIRDRVSADIEFSELITFHEAIHRLLTVHQFLGFVAGRRQNVSDVFLWIGHGRKRLGPLQVYWSLPLHRESSDRSPRGRDLPISVQQDPDVFASVLTRWLARHASWSDARARCQGSFDKGREYSFDRLVGAANMFDILPSGIVPSRVSISSEVQEAERQAKLIFRKLPRSAEREAVLRALGGLYRSSLRDKIEARAKPILDQIGDRLPGLTEVVRYAVDCRNHYVHGSDPKLPYADHFFETVPFMTDALDFIFGASDLMDSGWDLAEFAARPTTGSHPWAFFLRTYAGSRAQLQAIASSDRTE